MQLYDEPSELAATVRAFLDAGLRNGQPAIVIARPELAHSLDANDHLTVVDAEETLARFMTDDGPSPELFETIVGGLVDLTAERYLGTTIRAFGEMVDVLWQRGDRAHAIALEDLWNELAATRNFALLCGYHIDVFDADLQREGLPDVLRVHTHARPADPSRAAAAVDGALTDILGAVDASRAYLRISQEVPLTGIPRVQAMLGWLSANEPRLASRVLSRARALYST